MKIKDLFKTVIDASFIERTTLFSTISMVGNFAFGIIKFFVAILMGSIFIGAGGFATLSLGLAKWTYFKKKDENKSLNAVLVIMMTFGFIYIVSMLLQIIYTHQIINIGLIPAITVATVSFLEIGLAIYGFVKSIKMEAKSLTILKSIHLCSAMTAIVLTQSVLLSIGSTELDHYLYDSLFGVGVGALCILITIILMVSSVKKQEELNEQS